jgi:hypothetical protein
VVAIAAGLGHSLALKADGTVVAWGSYYSGGGGGQLPMVVPSGLTNVVAIASGSDTALALKADGTLVGWGSSYNGATSVPLNLSKVVAIAGANLAIVGEGKPVLTTRLVGINQAVYPKATVLLNAPAVGKWPLSYQWQLNGTNLAGATSPYLLLTNVLPSAAGSYVVVVTNIAGAITSAPPISLVVLTNPVILTPPQNQQLFAGDTAAFSVMAEGPSPLSYHWWKGNAPLNDDARITGSESNLLSITNTTMQDAGNYSVVVSSPYASVTSSVVALTVLFPLGQSLESSDLSWYVWGNAGWITQTNVTHGGGWAAQSGHLAHNQYSSMGTEVVGPGTLTFWWKVSAESGYDYLRFSGSGHYATISGETEWLLVTFRIDPGWDLLEWGFA